MSSRGFQHSGLYGLPSLYDQQGEVVADLTVTNLSASRLVATDASKKLASVGNLATWIAGTSNQVTVGDDGDGSVTLSLPQDIHTGASPTFAGATLSGLTAGRVVYTDTGGLLAVDAGLLYDAGTDILTVGTGVTTPLVNASGGTLSLATSGTARWIVNSSGHLLGNVNNTYDIGDAAAAGKPRNLYWGTQALAPDGAATAGNVSYSFASDTDSGIYWVAANNYAFVAGGAPLLLLASTPVARFGATTSVSWSSNANPTLAAQDVNLSRNAAGILDLHNSTTTSAQFNVYNTRTSTSDYERLNLEWVSNIARIRTTSAGTGSGRLLRLAFANSSSIAIDIPSSATSAVEFVASGITAAQPLGRVDVCAQGSNTATSGTHADMRFSGQYNPSASSTMHATALFFRNTINYSGGGVGRVTLLRFDPVNTALPTGNNGAIALSSTASTLGGQWFFNTTNETSAWEAGRIMWSSNEFLISTELGGAATARNIVFSSRSDRYDFRRTTNEQQINVFGTYTSDTNHEVLKIWWASSTAYLITDAGSGGGTHRNLVIGTAGSASAYVYTNNTARAYWDASGHLLPNVDSTYDLGSSGPLYWRAVYADTVYTGTVSASTSLVAPQVTAHTYTYDGSTLTISTTTSGDIYLNSVAQVYAEGTNLKLDFNDGEVDFLNQTSAGGSGTFAVSGAPATKAFDYWLRVKINGVAHAIPAMAL